jgi:hypothetical protein
VAASKSINAIFIAPDADLELVNAHFRGFY